MVGQLGDQVGVMPRRERARSSRRPAGSPQLFGEDVGRLPARARTGWSGSGRPPRRVSTRPRAAFLKRDIPCAGQRAFRVVRVLVAALGGDRVANKVEAVAIGHDCSPRPWRRSGGGPSASRRSIVAPAPRDHVREAAHAARGTPRAVPSSHVTERRSSRSTSAPNGAFSRCSQPANVPGDDLQVVLTPEEVLEPPQRADRPPASAPCRTRG